MDYIDGHETQFGHVVQGTEGLDDSSVHSARRPQGARTAKHSALGTSQGVPRSRPGARLSPSTHPVIGTYDARYPLDEPGTELSDNARVWRIYYDEAVEGDEEMVQEYKESIDILLVFVSPSFGSSSSINPLRRVRLVCSLRLRQHSSSRRINPHRWTTHRHLHYSSVRSLGHSSITQISPTRFLPISPSNLPKWIISRPSISFGTQVCSSAWPLL